MIFISSLQCAILNCVYCRHLKHLSAEQICRLFKAFLAYVWAGWALLGCLVSSGPAWLLGDRSSCQISSLPTEQAVGTSISLQTAARSCSWLSAGFCVPLETSTHHWPDFVASPDTRRNNTEKWFEAEQPQRGEELFFRWGGADKDTSARPRLSTAVPFLQWHSQGLQSWSFSTDATAGAGGWTTTSKVSQCINSLTLQNNCF